MEARVLPVGYIFNTQLKEIKMVLMIHIIDPCPMYLGCIAIDDDDGEPIQTIEKLFDEFKEDHLSNAAFPNWLAGNVVGVEIVRFDSDDGELPLQVYLKS